MPLFLAILIFGPLASEASDIGNRQLLLSRFPCRLVSSDGAAVRLTAISRDVEYLQPFSAFVGVDTSCFCNSYQVELWVESYSCSTLIGLAVRCCPAYILG